MIDLNRAAQILFVLVFLTFGVLVLAKTEPQVCIQAYEPQEIIDLASRNLGLLRALPRKFTNNKDIRSLENQLELCVRIQKGCEPALERIVKALEPEMEAYLSRLSKLEGDLEDLGLSDESKLDAAETLLGKIKNCRDTFLTSCADLESESLRLLEKSETVAPRRRFQINARPIQEIQRLTFLSVEQRNRVSQIINRQYGLAYQRAVARRDGRFDLETPTPIENLNTMLMDLLGKNVEIKDDETKILLTSANGRHRVALDPIDRYFTTWKKTASGEWQYAFFKIGKHGTVHSVDRPLGRRWVELSHFRY